MHMHGINLKHENMNMHRAGARGASPKTYLKASSNGDHNANDLVLHHQCIISWKVAADGNPSQCQQKATARTD